MRGPMAAAGAQVGLRALSDYDDLFALGAMGVLGHGAALTEEVSQ